MTTVLVDADGIAFLAAAAVQRSIAWDEDLYTTHASLTEAQDVFALKISQIVEWSECAEEDIILCYSCPSRRYFRHDLLGTYKGNRTGPPPLVLRDLKEWTKEHWPHKWKPKLEADDVMGIMATNPKLVKGEAIIVSADKDLQQIPGLHLNANAMFEGIFRVQPQYAERFLWQQVLVGDTADNYSGCPGVGPVAAEKVLSKAADIGYEAAVSEAYHKAGLTPADLAIQVNVARILHSSHYNYKTQEPILWQTSTTHWPSAAPATGSSPTTPKSRKTSKTSPEQPQAGSASAPAKRKASSSSGTSKPASSTETPTTTTVGGTSAATPSSSLTNSTGLRRVRRAK